jgi:hypothetical protein
VYEADVPIHPNRVGVTVTVVVIADEVVFVAIKLETSPVPDTTKPVFVLSLFQT